MSFPFGKSSSYYDLLYKDKDYSAESLFLLDYLRKYDVTSGHILELGCGTGIHACLLANAGYKVNAIDISEEMIRRARIRSSHNTRCTFSVADVRNYFCNSRHDAVISLFHVFSYQTTNADLISTIKTASSNLKPSGILIFDFWYGPAVLSQKPSVTVKRAYSDSLHIIRTAQPELHTTRNVVDVNYTIDVFNVLEGAHLSFTETHSMRYFFLPELLYMLSSSGFSILESASWLDGGNLSTSSWSGMIVARHECN
jgi:SAM-dependent methyltransferase